MTICKGSTDGFCAVYFSIIMLALGEVAVLGWSHILIQLKSDVGINVGAGFPGVTGCSL